MKDCLSAERENDKTQFRRWHLGNDISLSSVFLEGTFKVTTMISKSCRNLPLAAKGQKICQTGRVSYVPCIRHNFKTLKKEEQLAVKQIFVVGHTTPNSKILDCHCNNAFLSRLSVSETEEYVCTKTVFMNGSTVRDCQKTYTGLLRQH